MKERLINELQKLSFSDDDIDIILHMCRKHDDDIIKLYNYIVDNDVTKRDDVTLYAMRLCGLGNSKIIIDQDTE